MNFEVTPQSGGSIFLFEGTMQDDSGWLNVEYEQSDKTFSFEQCLYAEATMIDAEGSETKFEGVVYSKGTDITIDNSGYFQGWYENAYVTNSTDGSWEIMAMEAELFRGEMNSAGDVGTGAALFSDADDNPSTGTRLFASGSYSDFPSGAPTTISSDNLTEWAATLSSTELKEKDNENNFSEGFWEILYHMDDSTDYVRISDDTKNETIQENEYEGFKAGFTESYAGNPASRADLTNWQQDSLIIERMDS